MAKDEKIWIPDNYYNGFLRGCMTNEAIETTPSKTALENAGCEISGMCYLVLPDGKQHNPRIMKPNEFPSSIRALFEITPDAGDPNEEMVTPEPPKAMDVIEEATHLVCDTCGENKPMEAFKKKPGRGVLRKSTCIECETNAKEQMPQFKEDTPPAPQSDPAPKSEVVEGAVVVPAKPTVAVTLDYLKRIATEAFERGREFERNNVQTVEYSLDELLGIGA